jgi:hypothetical protein
MSMSRKDLCLTVGTALLSFFGAIAGVYLASRFDQSNWEKRFESTSPRFE